MFVGDEGRGDVEDLACLVGLAPAERQTQLQERPLEDTVLRVGQETLECLGYLDALERERGVEVVEQRCPQFIRNDGRDHGAFSWLRMRS